MRRADKEITDKTLIDKILIEAEVIRLEFKNELPTLEEYKHLRSAVGWKIVDDKSILKGLDSSTYSILAK